MFRRRAGPAGGSHGGGGGVDREGVERTEGKEVVCLRAVTFLKPRARSFTSFRMTIRSSWWDSFIPRFRRGFFALVLRGIGGAGRAAEDATRPGSPRQGEQR